MKKLLRQCWIWWKVIRSLWKRRRKWLRNSLQLKMLERWSVFRPDVHDLVNFLMCSPFFQDPKRHLEEQVDKLMTSNISQCLGAMLHSVAFKWWSDLFAGVLVKMAKISSYSDLRFLRFYCQKLEDLLLQDLGWRGAIEMFKYPLEWREIDRNCLFKIYFKIHSSISNEKNNKNGKLKSKLDMVELISRKESVESGGWLSGCWDPPELPVKRKKLWMSSKFKLKQWRNQD